MKKLSIRLRLTCMSAILLTACCIILYIAISNSAIMRMDSFETEVLNFQLFDTDISTGGDFSINIASAIPELINNLDATKHAFQIQCLIVTIIVIVTGTFLTWFMASLALRPLKDLNTRISKITTSNLSDEIPVSESQDEISELTRSFNHMLNRLDDAFTSQKQFAANAAHELRTPLAVMQTNLEVCKKRESRDINSYKEILDITLHQTEQLGKLTNTLLELMSLHTASLTDTVELSGLIAEIFCDLAPIADAKGIEPNQSGPEVSIQGNEVLLYHAFYNLIENAIKYNHENGNISVEINKKDNKIFVLISDSGDGIKQEFWNQIFDPFYRVDKARSRSMGGAGLGLALVKDIIALHSGKVYVKSSSDKGTTICVEL